MSEEKQASASTTQPVVIKTAASLSTNVVLLIGIVAICASIFYVGADKKGEAAEKAEQATPAQMELGDDFWLNLPIEVKDLRDKLAHETVILNEQLATVADKVTQVANAAEETPEIEKLAEEIDIVVGAQREKVRLLQRDFVRRINGLRATYIQKKMNR